MNRNTENLRKLFVIIKKFAPVLIASATFYGWRRTLQTSYADKYMAEELKKGKSELEAAEIAKKKSRANF